MIAKPFIKWAGGKRQLAKQILELLPKQINTYYEPFVGGGAIFFALAAENRFKDALLNDANAELVNTYKVIQTNPHELIQQLKLCENTKEFFLAVRDLNAIGDLDLDNIDRAAGFIYLNKTGFNGLYRVNKSGKFNVPFGKYENPNICDEDNILKCHNILSKTVITCSDFSVKVKYAEPGDAIYFDPPYVPLTPTSNFAAYTKDGFTIDDQERLAKLFSDLVGRGVHTVLSNSDTPVIRELYKDFEIKSVQARRSINSKGDSRGKVGEVIVVGKP